MESMTHDGFVWQISYAENPGTVKYSLLIRDCFQDLVEAASKNKDELYQSTISYRKT